MIYIIRMRNGFLCAIDTNTVLCVFGLYVAPDFDVELGFASAPLYNFN